MIEELHLAVPRKRLGFKGCFFFGDMAVFGVKRFALSVVEVSWDLECFEVKDIFFIVLMLLANEVDL